MAFAGGLPAARQTVMSGAGGNTTSLRVRAVTWNVGELDGEYYETHMLIPLLLGAERAQTDIVAIGLQECEMSASAFLSAGVAYDETEKGAKWTATFERTLATHRFVKLASCQLMGVHLSVFARESVAAAIEPGSVQLGNVGTGFGGMGFNKGGIAVRLELAGASWLFLNCHLAAGQSKQSARNSDWKKIVSRLSAWSSPLPGGGYSSPTPGRLGMECDHVILFGDMNYRIEVPDMNEQELRAALEPLRSGEAVGHVPSSLLDCDQLNIEKRAGRVFEGFEEQPITFAPTYKYDENTDDFDSSEKQRSPSWCDRIMWRSSDRIMPVEGSYTSVTSLKGSDHRPVGLDLLVICEDFPPAVTKAIEADRAALVPLPAKDLAVDSSDTVMPSTFFHVAPDGSHEPYSPEDSLLIATARANGQSTVRVSDVTLSDSAADGGDDNVLLQLEVRFGGNAWSSRMPQGSSTGMLQVNLDHTEVSRRVVELPACWGGTAALTESVSTGVEWQMGIGGVSAAAAAAAAAAPDEQEQEQEQEQEVGTTWVPLDEALVMSVVTFYMSGGPLYSSIVRLSPEQEVDLYLSQVRRLGLHRYFYQGGTAVENPVRHFYSAVDNILIRSAVDFEEKSVAIEDVYLAKTDGSGEIDPTAPPLCFEIRFGTNATSPYMITPPATGMIQVNLGSNNTRVVDKIDDGIEILKIRQISLPPLSEQRTSYRVVPSAAAAAGDDVGAEAGAMNVPGSEPEPEPEAGDSLTRQGTSPEDAEILLRSKMQEEEDKQHAAQRTTVASRIKSSAGYDDEGTAHLLLALFQPFPSQLFSQISMTDRADEDA